ncbi:MAG: hypothetical protein VXZ08_01100, partial [Verrucomicrobiota bacterium]|nr:hypothetical protein [Verrucomicrobiota bacterium]
MTIDGLVSQQRKQFFPINSAFRDYLAEYQRGIDLPISYEDLIDYDDAFPLINKNGKDTLWLTLIYEQQRGRELYEGLKKIY